MGFIILCAIGLGLLALLLGLSSLTMLGSGRKILGVLTLVVGIVCLAFASLGFAVVVGSRGYEDITGQTVAATVEARPSGRSGLIARFEFPDGLTRQFRIEGRQLFVSARILRWNSSTSPFGLETSYELHRAAGNAVDLQSGEPSDSLGVYDLSSAKAFDLYALADRFALLSGLVRPQRGVATLRPSEQRRRFELLVSAGGLQFQPVRDERNF